MVEERLISANKLAETVKGISKDAGFYRPLYEGFLNIIAQAPTVNAMDVVFCRDCKNWGCRNAGRLNLAMCGKFNNVMRGFDFCSWGERKDNGKTD